MTTKAKPYEQHPVDWRELKVIRVGHYMWARYKESLKSETANQSGALYSALEQVWAIKKELRASLKAERAVRSAQVKQYFRERAA